MIVLSTKQLTTSVQHKRKGLHKIKIFIDVIYIYAINTQTSQTNLPDWESMWPADEIVTGCWLDQQSGGPLFS